MDPVTLGPEKKKSSQIVKHMNEFKITNEDKLVAIGYRNRFWSETDNPALQ
jgi:hypothetical protein